MSVSRLRSESESAAHDKAEDSTHGKRVVGDRKAVGSARRSFRSVL